MREGRHLACHQVPWKKGHRSCSCLCQVQRRRVPRHGTSRITSRTQPYSYAASLPNEDIRWQRSVRWENPLPFRHSNSGARLTWARTLICIGSLTRSRQLMQSYVLIPISLCGTSQRKPSKSTSRFGSWPADPISSQLFVQRRRYRSIGTALLPTHRFKAPISSTLRASVSNSCSTVVTAAVPGQLCLRRPRARIDIGETNHPLGNPASGRKQSSRISRSRCAGIVEGAFAKGASFLKGGRCSQLSASFPSPRRNNASTRASSSH
jgi:hypothetical protein